MAVKYKKNKKPELGFALCKNEILFLFLLVFSTVIIYINSFGNYFIFLDDSEYVINNPYIKNLSFINLLYFFSSLVKGDYLPLTLLSYAVDHSIGGLFPYIYHLSNLIYHLLNAVLVYFLAKALFNKNEVGYISAILFSIHPMHAESVLWIAERKDLLHVLFYLASLICYVLYKQRSNNKKYYIASIILFIFALFSKSAAATLPLLLFCIDYYLSYGFNKRTLLEKTPYLLLSLLFGVITILSKLNGPEQFVDNLGSSFAWYDRILFVTYNLMFYLIKFFIPYHLSFLHSYPSKVNGLLPIEFYLSLVGILALVFCVWKLKQLRKDILFSLLFFLSTLLLVIKILPFAGQLVAERYTYLPYVGISFLIGQIYSLIKTGEIYLPAKIKKCLPFGLIIIFLIFSVITFNRVNVWNNSITLYSDVIEKEPNSPIGYHQRGYAKVESYRDFSSAVEDFNRSIQVDSTFFPGYNSRGWANYNLGNFLLALNDYNKAILLNPMFTAAYNNRGIVKRRLNDFTGALADYNKTIELSNSNPSAYFNRGFLKLNLKDTLHAIEDFKKADALGHPQAQEYLKKILK